MLEGQPGLSLAPLIISDGGGAAGGGGSIIHFLNSKLKLTFSLLVTSWHIGELVEVTLSMRQLIAVYIS